MDYDKLWQTISPIDWVLKNPTIINQQGGHCSTGAGHGASIKASRRSSLLGIWSNLAGNAPGNPNREAPSGAITKHPMGPHDPHDAFQVSRFLCSLHRDGPFPTSRSFKFDDWPCNSLCPAMSHESVQVEHHFWEQRDPAFCKNL